MPIQFETVLDLIDLVDPETGRIESDKLPETIIVGLRQGTRAELDAADPPLEFDEPAFETNTEVFRIGDVRYTLKTLDTSSSIVAKPGDDLAAKLAEANALTPGGAAKSATNRAALVLLPGMYSLDAELTLSTDFVDLVGLGAGTKSPHVFLTDFRVHVPDTVTDCRISGVSTGTLQFSVVGLSDPLNDDRIFTNCTGGNNSFGAGNNASSTFINCTAGDSSFGSGGNSASGTFLNCTAGNLSFDTPSGTFKDCTGGNNSFGNGAVASGTFINCTAGANSFATNNEASGTFTNCIGGSLSFGGDLGTLTGKLYYCRLTSGTFQTVSGGGITRLCIDGNNTENNQG